MKLEDTIAFVAIAGAGGLRAAEAASGLPRSALSRRLSRLERRLGVQLAKRSPQSFALTPAGERLFAECEAAMSRVSAVENELLNLQSRPAGLIRVTAPMPLAHVFLPDVLPAFLARHPEIVVTIDAEGRKAELASEAYDLALRVGDAGAGAHKVRRLFEECEAIYASEALLGALGEPRHPADLAGRPCILNRRSADLGGGAAWTLTDGRTEQSVEISVRLAISDPLAAREYCAAGLGFASLPKFVGDAAVAQGRLVRVLRDWTSPRIHIRVVLPHRPTAAARALLDHLVIEAKRRWPTYGTDDG